MALVVFLKGVNVGGHRTFRPSRLTRALKQFNAVNVGAAGTFVIRTRASVRRVRSEILKRLPFDAHVIVVSGRELLRLTAHNAFTRVRAGREIIRFVSVLARPRRLSRRLPFDIPGDADWGVRVLAVRGRFVLGLHRRQMKAIGQLGLLEREIGTTMTTRQWSTMQAIAAILSES